MTNWDPVDTVMTPWRQKIHDLMSDESKVAPTTTFACCDFAACDRSVGGCLSSGRRGDWAYVGAQYGEAVIGGRSARVLFLSMDRPHNQGSGEGSLRPFEMDQHTFRHGALDRSNPHMGGVDAELEALVDPGVSAEDRCEQFALVNAVLCGPPGDAGMTSVSSGTMTANCEKHARSVIRALEPDIVIAQGQNPQRICRSLSTKGVARWEVKKKPAGSRPALPKRNRVAAVHRGDTGGRRVWFVLTAHPSHYSRKGIRFWSSCAMPEELTMAFATVREQYAAGDGIE